MNLLTRVSGKKKKLIVGLMSGTSADGIDAVLVEVAGNGSTTKFRQLSFLVHPFPPGLGQFLIRQSDRATARLDDITRLHILLGELFAEAASRVTRKAGRRLPEIDLIGSHGQTIHHLPAATSVFGKNIRSTLQIGAPSVIAKRTGVITIGDFRVGDVAVGGSGAPLVPYFDFIAFRSRSVHRAALNLGGIANITVLPKKCTIDDVYAFDTGPGNMIIDGLMQALFDRPYDKNGAIASAGNILPGVLKRLMAHAYFRIKPPKSTGRETFGARLINGLARTARSRRPQDLVATAAEFTALTIYDQYLRFVRGRTPLDELIVSGGGVHNIFLMTALRRYFGGVHVLTADTLMIDSDAKEAICFALLANETVANIPANVPGATGALKATVLGVIGLP